MTKDEALKLALEALDGLSEPYDVLKAQEAIREALAQSEPEPEVVAVIGNWGRVEWRDGVYPQLGDRMYSAPFHRKPLTDEEILTVARNHYNLHQRAEISFARAIEAAHGIKE